MMFNVWLPFVKQIWPSQGHAPQSCPISMDPLLALRQLISAVDWCLAKEERLAADSLKTLALGCVEPDVGRKRAAEDRG